MKETSLSGSWKRRARANQLGNDLGLYRSSLGKNKANGGNAKETEVSKKQKYVSSPENSTEASVDEESTGRFLPACRSQ